MSGEDEQSDRGDGADPPPSEGGVPKPSGRYAMLVGLAFLVLIGVATLNTLRTNEGGILAGRVDRGEPLAEFAVPDARGDVVADANVFQDDCETSANPCPADARRTPACRVDDPNAIRVCDFFDRPLVISFWFTRGGDCLPTQDLIDRLARRYRGRVGFLSIDVRDDPEEVRRIIRERDWQIPVGYDRDGAVSNIYRVGVCPTVAFAYPGGILREARIGTEELSERQLTGAIDRLLVASRRRAQATR